MNIRHTPIAGAIVMMFSAAVPPAPLASAIARQWALANRMKLVLETPHTLVRGNEDGKTYFVEIFTWRDANIPDAPPAAIQNIWAEMNQLVEWRGGKPGIDFAAVSVIPQ